MAEKPNANGGFRRHREDPSGLSMAIEQCSQGNADAFGLIYDSYVNKVFKYTLHMCGNGSEAEDMTEEVFVKAWQSLPSFRGGEGALGTWLMRIAHNHVVDALRRRRNDTIPLPVFEGEIASDATDNPQSTAERRLLGRQVLQLMAELPQQQRQVMVLKFVHGLDTHEVSEITGQKDGTIRIAQMRALQALRSRLSGPEVAYAG